jgi:hypothetical protein
LNLKKANGGMRMERPSFERRLPSFADRPMLRTLLACYFLIVKHLQYIVAAGAIGFAVWAMMGAPSPSHPDSRVAQSAGRH